MSTKSACHWLPCSIEYDGKAPVSQYFRPEAVDPSKPDDTQAATFRGRGLLGKIQSLPPGIHGNVLLQSSQEGKVLTSQLDFEHVYEWEHECNKERLIQSTDTDKLIPVEDIHSQSSVQKSIALMDLMRVVHEEITFNE